MAEASCSPVEPLRKGCLIVASSSRRRRSMAPHFLRTAMHRSLLTALALSVGLLSGCGGDNSSASAAAAHDVKLQGAGASFPAPLYTKWFKAYTAAHQSVQVDYQSVGSGSGVKSVIDHTVD